MLGNLRGGGKVEIDEVELDMGGGFTVGVGIMGMERILNWVWFRPKRVEKLLRQQGLAGNSYRFLFGDTKEITAAVRQARTSQPMSFSHHIAPRITPYAYPTITNTEIIITSIYAKTWILKYVTFSVLATSISVLLINHVPFSPLALAPPFSLSFFIRSVRNCSTSCVGRGVGEIGADLRERDRIGTTPRVYITEPEQVKIVFSQINEFHKTSSFPFRRRRRSGLVSLEGRPKWAKHRKIINPAFHVDKLKDMFPAFSKRCREMEEKIIFLLLKEAASLFTTYLTNRVYFIPGFRYIPTKLNKRMGEIDRKIRDMVLSIITKRQNAMEKVEASKNENLLGILLESNASQIEEQQNKKDVGMSIEELHCLLGQLFYLVDTRYGKIERAQKSWRFLEVLELGF
ncbi:secologanin synthase-like [Cucumis sativus]|nr:secologanin synthase-like [Cucumis sativus]